MKAKTIKALNPLEISYRDYLAMTDEQAELVQKKFNDEKSPQYERLLFEKNAEWLVVCGGEVVKLSQDPDDIPDEEELEAIAKARDRIPFLVCRPPVIEESAWQPTTSPRDYYPTLNVKVRGDGAELAITSDFDTGATISFFDFDRLLAHGIIKHRRVETLRSKDHLGQPYGYYEKRVRIEIDDESNRAKSQALRVLCVRNWAQSPFRLVNPQREALTGRDLLLKFKMKVELDGAQRKTRIYHV